VSAFDEDRNRILNGSGHRGCFGFAAVEQVADAAGGGQRVGERGRAGVVGEVRW
jgi:hypothetical protein